jgi:hypothetical protein
VFGNGLVPDAAFAAEEYHTIPVPVTIILPIVSVEVNDCAAAPVGAGVLLTVIVMVAVVAHNPEVGVNVYVVVAVLLIADDQVPETPSIEIIGKAATVEPEQTGATCVNVGVTRGFTVTVIVDCVAHTPVVGVNT